MGEREVGCWSAGFGRVVCCWFACLFVDLRLVG